MRFLRHLAAAVATVGVVVALGVAWAHSSAASLIAPGGGSGLSPEVRLSAPGAVRIINGRIVKGGPVGPGGLPVFRAGGGAPASLANAPTLLRLAILEAMIIAVAAMAERAWYRRRRARRLSPAGGPGRGPGGTPVP